MMCDIDLLQGAGGQSICVMRPAATFENFVYMIYIYIYIVLVVKVKVK